MPAGATAAAHTSITTLARFEEELMHVQRSILLFGILGILAVPIGADAQLVRSGSPELTFKAFGTIGFSMTGKTAEVNVSDTAQNISVIVPLGTLSTDNGVRDKHLKDRLEVTKYPTAELSVSKAALKIPAEGQNSSADTDGTLKLHGQSRTVRFHYEAKRNGNAYHVDGKMRVNFNQFGVEVPSYLGITVKPDVDVAVHFDAVDK
jgi:polyisoprenoid-binding protein YceI